MTGAPGLRESMSRCFTNPECIMTAGYYIGGGMWICWWHAMRDGFLDAIMRTGQRMNALPREGGS